MKSNYQKYHRQATFLNSSIDKDQAPSYIDLSFLFIFRRASFPISHCNALWKYFFPIRLGVQCQDKFLGLAQENDGKKVNTNSVQN